MPSQRQIDQVRDSIRRLASRARLLLVSQRVLITFAIAGAVILLAGAIDYGLRFPAWIRWLHLLAGIAALGFIAWTYLRPAFGFRPSLTRLALRIEKRHPHLKDLLASGVEFGDGGDASADSPDALSRSLADMVATRAAGEWTPEDLRGVLRVRPALRAAGALGATVVLIGAVALLRPDLSAIGAQRIFAPWSGAQWPKRTQVADVTDLEVHPLGAALPLRAALLRSHRDEDRTDVSARLRLIVDDQVRSTRRDLLTWQERAVPVERGAAREGDRGSSAGAAIARGQLFERLIEVDADAVEYRFETLDDATEWRRIELIDPPAVLAATADITPPAYAAELAGAPDAQGLLGASNLEMGPGRDERAVAPRALAGSEVGLTLRFNKPLPDPPAPDSPEYDSWLVSTLGPDASDAGLIVTPAPDAPAWRLNWTMSDSLRLNVRLEDRYAITSVEEAVYRFEAAIDQPPSVTVTEPDVDRNVLATSVVEVVGEGRDDVGLDSVWIMRQKATSAGAPGSEPSGPGGAVEPVGEPTEIARSSDVGARSLLARTTVDLSVLGLRPGDEIRLTAVATDVLATRSEAREPVESRVRTLFVISEEEFIEEIRSSLGGIRSSAIRIDQQQDEVRTRVRRRGIDDATRRAQAQISERVAREGENVDALQRRIDQSGLSDDALDALLDDARSLLEEAGERSNESSRRMDEIGNASPPVRGGADRGSEGDAGSDAKPGRSEDDAPPQDGAPGEAEPQDGDAPAPDGDGEQQAQDGASGDQADREPGDRAEEASEDVRPGEESDSDAADQERAPDGDRPAGGAPMNERDAAALDQAQEGVQERLTSLIEMLDRGEDAWVVRRQLEYLVEEQRELREQTDDAGRDTTGREVEELDERERSELERIVQRQQDLAEQLEELVDELSQRSRDLEDSDPTAAAGMRAAARAARENEVGESMEQAAEQAGQNQMAQAGQSQDEALERLEQMQEQLDEADRAREEVLSRILASVIESLEGLIRQQERALAELTQAEQRGDFGGLDEGMIRLNQNTFGVLDQARAAGRELAPVVNLLGQAADAQSRAIISLRRDDPIAEAVREDEAASLRLLREARDKAEEINQQLEQEMQDRQRRELRQKYREILERQVVVTSDTSPLAEAGDLNRRERIAARRLGDQQRGIRGDLAAIVEETEGLTKARVFDYAHDRLDGLTAGASTALLEGDPGAALPDAEAAVVILQGLVEALRENQQNEDDNFNQGGGGGQGQSGGGDTELIPPIAELRLLRQIQADVASRTRRSADGASGESMSEIGQQQRELGEIGQDLIERMQQQQGGGGSR